MIQPVRRLWASSIAIASLLTGVCLEAVLPQPVYGLILPNNDPRWRTTVNQFLRESEAVQTILDQDVRDLDYCLNR